MTPELREARRGMLTGSMAAVIMGGLSTDGLARYVNKLAFERLYGLPDGEDFQSQAMLTGIEREAQALDWYAFDQDCILIPGDQFLVHPKLPFVGATLIEVLRQRLSGVQPAPPAAPPVSMRRPWARSLPSGESPARPGG